MNVDQESLAHDYPVSLDRFSFENLSDLDRLIETRMPFRHMVEISEELVETGCTDRILGPVFSESGTRAYIAELVRPLVSGIDVKTLVKTADGNIREVTILMASDFSMTALLQIGDEKLREAYSRVVDCLRESVPRFLFFDSYHSATRVIVSLIRDNNEELLNVVRKTLAVLMWDGEGRSGDRLETVFRLYACLKLVAYKLAEEPRYR